MVISKYKCRARSQITADVVLEEERREKGGRDGNNGFGNLRRRNKRSPKQHHKTPFIPERGFANVIGCMYKVEQLLPLCVYSRKKIP